MGEKDRPFSFEGFTLGFIDGDGFKELPIVDNLTDWHDTISVIPDRTATLDKSEVERIKNGTWNFKCDMPDLHKEEFDKFLRTNIQQGNDNVRSVYIQCVDEYINRPKNLKYPNKKRARRIWNKWRNRFGVREAKYYVIPKATIKPRYEFKNGQLMCDVQITAEKISE